MNGQGLMRKTKDEVNQVGDVMKLSWARSHLHLAKHDWNAWPSVRQNPFFNAPQARL